MSPLGQARLRRAEGRSGHVGYPPTATEFCVAEKFRDVHTTGLMRCHNGAATSLLFPVAVMAERNANRLVVTTEPGRDTAIPGEVLVMKMSAAPP